MSGNCERQRGTATGDSTFHSRDSSVWLRDAVRTVEPRGQRGALTQHGLTQLQVFSTGLQRTRKDPKGGLSSKLFESKTEKLYQGVRVRMPVREMLSRIRLARGLDPNSSQGTTRKMSSGLGEKKRVCSSVYQRSTANKKQTQSLEDLAIIVEILEEDLKGSKPHRDPEKGFSGGLVSGVKDGSKARELFSSDDMFGCGPAARVKDVTGDGIVSTSKACCPPPQPLGTQSMAPFPTGFGIHYRYNSEDSFLNAPPPCITLNRSLGRWGTPPVVMPSIPCCQNPQYIPREHQEDMGCVPADWACDAAWDLDGTSSFPLQLKKEEIMLMTVSDEDLLTKDEKGRTMLHKAVTEGRRALVHVIARRIAALNQVDIRDADGKTALHLAAQENQCLMVADLLLFGASVNQRDRCGKTCLHLSAENGYISVLEVLKQSMRNGLFVDVDARDGGGWTPLQCVLAALHAGATPRPMRLHALRTQLLLDALACLLQMGALSQALGEPTSQVFADCATQPECCPSTLMYDACGMCRNMGLPHTWSDVCEPVWELNPAAPPPRELVP